MMAKAQTTIRKMRDEKVASIKEQATLKMNRIRQLRDKQIKDVQEEAFAEIQEASKTNNDIATKKSGHDKPKQKARPLKKRVLSKRRLSHAKQ
jgi:hypothetical protein